MKKWFCEILNSKYEEWIRWSIPLIITSISILFRFVRKVKQKHKKQNVLPWFGKIDGIDKY